jgi:uncharacterized protein (TIRG00374 family)
MGTSAEAATPTGVRQSINPTRRLVITAAKLLVSTTLIVWLLRRTDVGEILTAVGSADIGLLFLAYLMVILGHFFSVFRWRTLLHAQGYDASVWYLLKGFLVAMFFNNFLPSTIGGDVSRAYDSWKVGRSKGKALAVVFVDRFLGLFALLVLALIAVSLSNDVAAGLPLLQVWLVPAGLAMATVIWFIFAPNQQLASFIKRAAFSVSQRAGNFVDKGLSAFFSLEGKKGALLKALLLSLLLQLNVVLHYYVIAEALGLGVPLLDFFLLVPVSALIMIIPISINGIGIRENVFAFLLGGVGVATSDSVALAWIAYGFAVVQGTIGGIIYDLRR